MKEWEFNKDDLEKFIKNGEELLKKELTKKEKEEILYEINMLKSFLKGNYDYIEEDEYNDVILYKAKNKYLNEMKRLYKQLGKKTIQWFISLERDQIFFNNSNLEKITLPIDVQKEYTLKNYEKYSKNSLIVAKQILSPFPTNQIQICEELEDTSISRHFRIADMTLIVINPDEGAAILNHELQHAIETTIGYNTHYFYRELGSIFYEILYNNQIYNDKSILPTERLEDFDIEIEILSEYFQLMLEFAKYDFKVNTKEFKSIIIKKLNVIPDEFDDWLNEELEYDYEDNIKYIFSHLKAIELVSLVNTKQDTLDLLENYINTNKFIFEADYKKFKQYESYMNDVKEKILKR